MGTSRMILMGRARARKIGSMRYAGVVRKGRKWRRRRRTKVVMDAKANKAKVSDPNDDFIAVVTHIL
jgi:hypothetical protein